MKISDLRIGNIISVEPQTEYDEAVTIDGYVPCVVDAYVFKSIIEQPDRWAYVRLTDEWLTKLGFTLKEDVWSIGDFEISFDKDDKAYIYFYDQNFIRYIDYVHQLQNIYYLFEEKELHL